MNADAAAGFPSEATCLNRRFFYKDLRRQLYTAEGFRKTFESTCYISERYTFGCKGVFVVFDRFLLGKGPELNLYAHCFW